MSHYRKTDDNRVAISPTGGDYTRSAGVVKDTLHIVTAAEETSKVVSTGFRYNPAINILEVYLNGQYLRAIQNVNGTQYGDYSETTNFSVTFESGVIHTGDQLRFRITGASYDYSNKNSNDILQLAKTVYGRDSEALLKSDAKIFGEGLINVFSYATEQVPGYGYCHEGTIEDALADIGSDNKTLYIPNGTWRISPASFSLIIPSNVGLKVEHGVILEIADNCTLTINGPFQAGLYQVFDYIGTGVVSLGEGICSEIYSGWWNEEGLVVKKAYSRTNMATGNNYVFFTLTIPNLAQAAMAKITCIGSLGAGGAVGANESSHSLSVDIAITRTPGLTLVVTPSTTYGSAVSSVAGADNAILAFDFTDIIGALSAPQTLTLRANVTASGGLSDNHTAMMYVELINQNGSSITIE